MSWGINKVELVGFTILRGKGQRHALGFNGNAALALNVHGIENLSSHLTLSQAAADLNKAVSNGRFAVVNMGNNGKISDMT